MNFKTGNNVTNNTILNTKLTNRGTGAGGANTNKNGISYEELTNLNSEFNVLSNGKFAQKITFVNDCNHREFYTTKQAHFFKHMHAHIDFTIPQAHGCKRPDECFIDFTRKIIYIIEKKFQQTSGSVCEKIQTSDMKLWQFKRTFPLFHIVYVYCLSSWFIENMKAELQYLEHKKIPVFFGDDTTYKFDIVQFILNYKL